MSYWILQCNVKIFNWFEFINCLKENHHKDTWAIDPKRNETIINKMNNDYDNKAFIWLTKGHGIPLKDNRGIWAMGRITKKLDYNIKAVRCEDKFYYKTGKAIDFKERYSKLPRIEFEYDFKNTDKLIKNPILLEELIQNKINDLRVINNPWGVKICDISDTSLSIILNLIKNR